MLSKFVLQGLVLAIAATHANANPVPEADAIPEHFDESAGAEIVRFKRDAILDPRDLELAELHQVNLTEMYKHSVIKRDSGDHVTVWVNNNYDEGEGPEENPGLDKRADVRLSGGLHWVQDGWSDQCWGHDRKDATGPNGPTTGGLDAIVHWCNTHRGYFRWGSGVGGWDFKTVMIAGSNGGDNARYRAQFIDGRHQGSQKFIGVRDVRNDADWTRGQRRNFNGKWRAASYGWESCWGNILSQVGRANFEIRPTTENV